MLFVGFCGRFLRRTLDLSKHDPNEYAVDLRRSPGASPVRRDPPSLVVRELAVAERMRDAIEADGDRLTDLHLWRLGPGHLGAIVSVSTAKQRGPDYYRQMLGRFRSLSHVTVEIESR